MITSTANPRVKALARLSQRSERDSTGAFPIEGWRPIRRALDTGWPVVDVYLAPEIASAEAVAAAGMAAASGIAVTELGEAAFRRIAYRQNPDGVLAVGRTLPRRLDDLSLPATPLVLVAEGTEKPGNLGAMLRTADAAGVDVVIAADPATDLYNPNVVRAAQGSLFSVAVAVADAPASRHWLEERGVDIHAARPGSGAAPWDLDLAGPVALVVGAEHAGLTAAWDGTAAVTIPMSGLTDSLNASTAAAILVYEAHRQRSRRSEGISRQ